MKIQHTDLFTVFTTLKQQKEISNLLGHPDHTPVFFVMGLLTKALEITRFKPNKLACPCEGGMHLLLCVSAAIGWLYGDAGLKNLLIVSEVFAAGTVQQMLQGKYFDRGLYAFILVDEVLNNQFYKMFKAWCDQSEKIIPEDFLTSIEELKICLTNDQITLEQRVEIIDKFDIILEEVMMGLIEEFHKEGRELIHTLTLWDDYLTVMLLLMNRL